MPRTQISRVDSADKASVIHKAWITFQPAMAEVGGSETPPASVEYDVVVVGAGLSGLSCVRELQQRRVAPSGRTLRVLLVEARDRVGGRTSSLKLTGAVTGATPAGGATHLDVGGQWIGAQHTLALQLAKELELELVEQTWLTTAGTSSDTIVDTVGGASLVAGTGRPYDEMDSAAAALFERVVQRMDEMMQQVPLDTPWLAPEAQLWDATNLDDFFVHELGLASDSEVEEKSPEEHALRELRLMVRTIMASEPRDLSLLFTLHFVRTSGGIRMLGDGPNLAQHWKVKLGAQSLSKGMHQDLAGTRRGQAATVTCLFQHRVTRVRVCADDTAAIDCTPCGADGTPAGAKEPLSIRARYVVTAVPPPVLASVSWEPAPRFYKRVQLQHGMQMGACLKCLVVYNRAFWRDRLGKDGEVSRRHFTELGPVANVFEATLEQGLVALVGLIVGDTAREWTRREQKALELCSRPGADHVLPSSNPLCVAVLRQFELMYGTSAALSPICFMCKSWSLEPCSLGCYSGMLGPGLLTSVGDALVTPVGPVHWAGTETAVSGAGYFEGALCAGQRAAAAVCAALEQSIPSKL